MWFRVLLAGLCAGAWAFAFWLGSHVSSAPEVFGRWSKGYSAVVAAAGLLAVLLTAAHLGPIYRSLRPKGTRMLAVLFSVLGCLALLEGIVRLVDPLGISYYAAAMAYNRDKVPDAELTYRNPSNVHAVYGNVEYDFNDMGLRERAIRPKAPGEFRVLVLGDSIAFGWGAPVESTFVRRLEALLAKRLGRPVRTINSGVGSYNTTQEFGFLKRRGEEIAPDLVLLVYVDNDFEAPKPDLVRPEKSPPEVLQALLGHSWIYRLAVHVLRYGRGDGGAVPRDSPGWRESMEHVAAIADLCRARGTPFGAVLWRYRASPLTDALWADLSSVADAKGFPLGDMKPAFDGADFRAITVSPVDSHPNAEGHRRAAERIDAFLAPLLPR